jgi:hypothetical protein
VFGPGVARAWNEDNAHGSFAALVPFNPSLIGSHVIASSGGYTFGPATNTLSGTITAILSPPGGTYKVRFGSPDLGYVERTIVVPAN